MSKRDTSPNCLLAKGLADGGLYNRWFDFYQKGIGTLAYEDAWGLFDQVIISKG